MAEHTRVPEGPMHEEAYHELCAYTLGLGDPAFLHQQVVDAYAAQTATERSKPIGVAFALAGLYLHLEMGFTGREVQRAHMKLARDRTPWPTFAMPAERGKITAEVVLHAPAGAERDEAIHAWCESVWHAWGTSRERVILMLREQKIIP